MPGHNCYVADSHFRVDVTWTHTKHNVKICPSENKVLYNRFGKVADMNVRNIVLNPHECGIAGLNNRNTKIRYFNTMLD